MIFRPATRRVLTVAMCVCSAVVVFGHSSVAQAELWQWEFLVDYDDLFTVSDADVWAFRPDVNTVKTLDTPIIVTEGIPQYNWSFEISEVYVQLNSVLWQPTGATYADSGTHSGSFPIYLADERIDESEGGEQILATTLQLFVGEDGKAHFNIIDTVWGQYPFGNGFAPVTGIAVEGTMTVEAVPEPTGIALALIGAASLAVMVRRRRAS